MSIISVSGVHTLYTKPMQKEVGTLVISLDFELYWGMQDKVSLEEYGEHIVGVHEVGPKLLALFEEYDIHATWAMVGMLGFDSGEDVKRWIPNTEARPRYTKENISSYYYLEHAQELDEKYHFAPRLVEQIVRTAGQELGSHTFSHMYALEATNLEESFRADCRAQKEIFTRFGVTPRTLVFPRNQVNEAILQIAKEEGIAAYRGTESHILYRPREEAKQTNLVLRAFRLLDHFVPISGSQTYTLSYEKLPVTIPSSRQLRPYAKSLALFEWFRLKRITWAMKRAAKRGEVFHLWWHPHNFGTNQDQNLAFLRKIFTQYKKLQTKYGMQSKNMSELATNLPVA